MRKLSRRTLLGGAGLGLGSLWLPGVGRLNAQEENSPTDPKLLFVYAEAGWLTRHMDFRPPWAPSEWSDYVFYDAGKNAEIPDTLEWEFDLTDSRLTEADFPRVLRPLYRHRDIMTVVEGLSLLTTAIERYGDGHAQAHIHTWSGVPAVEGEDGTRSRGSAPSVDQRINEFIRQSNPDHQSMDFRVGDRELFHEWLYRSDGNGGAARVPTITSPQEAYDIFFGGFTAAEGGDPLADNASYAVNIALRQFDDLAPRLGASDRLKLEAHREMLSTLQRRMGRTVSCDSSIRPTEISGSRAERYLPDIEAFTRLVAAGFSCGISRVASIGSIIAPNETYGVPESVAIHHEYEHEIDPWNYYSNGGPTDTFVEKEEVMTLRNIRQTEALASMLDILREVPDGEGTLLDSTLVVYMSEMSHGSHGHEHFPTIMFGKGGNVMTPGRYIKYAQDNPIPFNRNYANRYTGPAHTQLLVSILQGFGMDIDYLGAPSLEVTDFKTQATSTLNMSGPLRRLRV